MNIQKIFLYFVFSISVQPVMAEINFDFEGVPEDKKKLTLSFFEAVEKKDYRKFSNFFATEFYGGNSNFIHKNNLYRMLIGKKIKIYNEKSGENQKDDEVTAVNSEILEYIQYTFFDQKAFRQDHHNEPYQSVINLLKEKTKFKVIHLKKGKVATDRELRDRGYTEHDRIFLKTGDKKNYTIIGLHFIKEDADWKIKGIYFKQALYYPYKTGHAITSFSFDNFP